MYAVIETGGKQYKVRPDSVLTVEKLGGDVGDQIALDRVVFATNDQGNPVSAANDLAKVQIAGEIIEQFRDDKVLVFKRKRRKKYRRTKGHRQYLTKVKITDIKFG